MGMKLTNKEAIYELEELVIKQARIGLFNEEVEAMHHAIEVLKRFEGAVELLKEASNLVGHPCTNISGSTDMACMEWQEKYKVYAIPKTKEEQEREQKNKLKQNGFMYRAKPKEQDDEL